MRNVHIRAFNMLNSWKDRVFHGVRGPRGASIRPAMIDLISRYRGTPIDVVEIGARYGDSSEMIIRSLSVSSYTIIDPYVTYDQYAEDGFNDVLGREGGDAILAGTRRRLGALHKRVRFIREFSNSRGAIDSVEDSSVALIFVDGNHERDFVLADLRNYFPKLKLGGCIVGDDFHMRHRMNDALGTLNDDLDRSMVYEAVEQFAKETGQKYFVYGIHRGYPKLFQFVRT